MKKIIYIFFIIVLSVLLLPIACTKSKSECSGCYGIIEFMNVPVVKWNFDSIKQRYPIARESDWCTILNQFNGQIIKDEKTGKELGVFKKQCPMTTP